MNTKLSTILIYLLFISGLVVLFKPSVPHSISPTIKSASSNGYSSKTITSGIYLPLVLSTSPSPTLVSAYLFRGPQPDYEIVRYRPRQFAAGLDVDPSTKVVLVDDPGPYMGWDLLNTPNEGINTILDLPDWVELTLNRPAKLAVVWRGGDPLPNWLSGWTRGQDIILDNDKTPVYTKVFTTSQVVLGSVYNPNQPTPYSRDTYLVLFAEANCSPSLPPPFPVGLEAPIPNQTCPKWVHDQYVVEGPDGKIYPTWHPQIDPVYWCYFHHEHGSNPAPYKPAFGYAAMQAGMSENHEGFKVYKFLAPNDVTVIITHHFGTASAVRAACVRFHEFDMAIFKAGKLVTDVHLLADHGKSQHARTDIDLRPTACPDQAAKADADGSNGRRKFQVASMNPVAYEPWQIDFDKTILGISDVFSINTPSRIADCNTLECNADVLTGDQGEFRFVTYGDSFGIIAGANTGIFFTDPYGRTVVAEGSPGAVRQYVMPGIKITLPPKATLSVECYITHPFGGVYVCQEENPLDANMNIEGSLRSPN